MGILPVRREVVLPFALAQKELNRLLERGFEQHMTSLVSCKKRGISVHIYELPNNKWRFAFVKRV